MALSKPGGEPGPPKRAGSFREEKARSKKGRGTVRAGFSFSGEDIDGKPVSDEATVHVATKRGAVSPTQDAGTSRSVN